MGTDTISIRKAQRNCTAEDNSPALDKEGIKFIQQVVGSFMYYCRATDPTIPVALNELAGCQSKATESLMKRSKHFLDYMATHPNAKIRYYPSDMIPECALRRILPQRTQRT
jgi:hypothetical protein